MLNLYCAFSIWICSKAQCNDQFTPIGPNSTYSRRIWQPLFNAVHACCYSFYRPRKDGKRSELQWQRRPCRYSALEKAGDWATDLWVGRQRSYHCANPSAFNWALLLYGYSHIIISCIGTFRLSGYHFQGSPSQTGYTMSRFCVLNRVFPENLLLFSPFDYKFCWFRALCWELWVKTQTSVPFFCFEYGNAFSWVLNRVSKEITALSLRQVSTISIFCVLNRVRVSLSRPNPLTQISVAWVPPPGL